MTGSGTSPPLLARLASIASRDLADRNISPGEAKDLLELVEAAMGAAILAYDPSKTDAQNDEYPATRSTAERGPCEVQVAAMTGPGTTLPCPKPKGEPAMDTWQERRAELLEMEADAIGGLMMQAERCAGIWEHGSEMDRLVAQVLDLGRLEIENRGRKAEDLRRPLAEAVGLRPAESGGRAG